MRYSLNSTDTHDANSNAISLCAYVPPYLPALTTRPMAFVDSIQFLDVRTKLFNPA
jgi:hypothetical protein